MITDEKVMHLRSLLRPTTSLKAAAAETGLDLKTARKYIRIAKLPSESRAPHRWRTRPDPFEGVWPKIVQQLENDREILPATLLASLMANQPGKFSGAQLRTLQRRIKQWKRERRHDRDPRYNPKVAFDWILAILRGERSVESLQNELGDIPQCSSLVRFTNASRARDRKKALAVLAYQKGIPAAFISEFLGLTLQTAKRYFKTFREHGVTTLFSRERAVIKKKDRPEYAEALFSTLHSPPSTHGINRTSWQVNDLHRVLAQNGFPMSRQSIRAILKKSGYKWRKARRVLTSKDPEYRQKVERITSILQGIGPNERFFSIDEYGPFHITRKVGRRLVAPGEDNSVPQWQKSKGCLIVTAALELCSNQVTHFYSERKNTDEMIRLLDLLLDQYSGLDVIYLSWDAASWHLSKRFYKRVAEMNAKRQAYPEAPRIELAPLPSGAQFLNVIESVFSGMARSIIHNSDYQSKAEAMAAIDRYLAERNSHFRSTPRRAGNKIWGAERVKPVFAEANNCKDPKWR